MKEHISITNSMTKKPKTLDWNTQEAKQRLFASKYNRDFFTLAHLFQPQLKPTYCGIASAVIILNAFRLYSGLKLEDTLDLAIPESHGGGTMRFNTYSQTTFLNAQTNKIKSKKLIEGKNIKDFDPGLNLENLANKMRLHLMEVSCLYADKTEIKALESLRNDLMAFLNDPEVFLIANYHGKTIGKEVGGHFSPIVAYEPESDSCLIMDVAGHKHPWFWVTVADLYKAMHTKDGETFRGWLRVSDKLAKK